jgi:uncharacterized small protein (TIGR04563 family)
MALTDKQKQSLYFPEDMLREIMTESVRLDRSLSWTVQQAWRVARVELRRFPTVGESAPALRAPAALRRPTALRTPRRDGEVRDAGGAEPREASAQVLEFLRGKFDRELAG